MEYYGWRRLIMKYTKSEEKRILDIIQQIDEIHKAREKENKRFYKLEKNHNIIKSNLNKQEAIGMPYFDF